MISSMSAISIANERNLEIEKKTVTFYQLEFNEINHDIRISLEGANSLLNEPGKPLVPCHIETIIFPSNTQIRHVSCTPKNVQTQSISGTLEKAPQIMQLGSGKVQKIDSNELMNSYPENWYEVKLGHGLVDGRRSVIVRVELHPVQYDPLDSTIKWADEINIDIEYEYDETIIQAEDQYDLLILSPSDLISELPDLVDHKNNRDISTILVDLDSIYDGYYFEAEGRDEQEQIKYFIKNAYDEWGISNVLLVGSRSLFPSRKTHIQVSNSDKEIFVSDIYYADIYNGNLEFSSWDTNENDIFAEYNWEGETDEIDLYPDVKIGRIACTQSSQVRTIVDKIINYENNKAYSSDWFGNLVVIGGDTVPGDDKGIDEGELVNQAIIDVMDGFSVEKIWYSNGRLNGIAPTGIQHISDEINNGCGFVDFSGHGAPYLWTTFPHNGSRQILPTPTGSYSNAMIGNLNNGDKLPIVVCGGCSLGKFQANTNCFAWSFLANPNGGGIASFGATGLGYIYVGEYVTYGLVEGLNLKIFEAYDNGAISFGEMWLDAVNDYLGSFDLNVGDYKTIEEWHPFGDPTLSISAMSQKPETPDTPIGPSSGKVGEEYEYTTLTTDPDGDNIYYFFEWSEDENSGWIGPFSSGEQGSASFTWEKRGNYEIRVKARDEHGSVSGWSDSLPVSMPQCKIQGPFFDFLSNHPLIQQMVLRIQNF
jgi:hypothetical protein